MKIALFSFHFALVLAAGQWFEVGVSHESSNNSVSAIFVFGDSTSDPGNNNYIATAFRSNFAPYGRDFPNKVPTGRFSNGRLTNDFIAGFIGIKEYIPPYLDPSLSMDELMTGVSFASAGSGFDPITSRISDVISMTRQLKYFSEYRKRVEEAFGKDKAATLINKAVFIVSAGTNDFVVNYYALPIRRRQFDVAAYQLFLMNYVEQFIKALWDQGARKIAVAGLPPMGCLPLVITANSANSAHQRGCEEAQSAVARDYNQLLQERLNSILLGLGDQATKIVYADIFSPVSNIIYDPARFGFEKINRGCCGTGYIEASFLCNPSSYVCPNASKFVFWDSIHPTEATYYLVFKFVRPIIDFLVAH